MVEMTDIKLDADFDVAVAAGDFVVGEVTRQNQELILLSRKGMWKQTPQCGVGLSDYLLDDGSRVALTGSIQEQFTADGMKVRRIMAKDLSNINVDSDYEVN